MRVDLFDYDLPRERIADHPVRPRDAARLLDMTGTGLADRSIGDLASLLGPDDLLVVNDTRVIPSRLDGWRGDARIEATLHRPAGSGRWKAFARPARRLRPGDTVRFAGGLDAVVLSRNAGEVELDFRLDDAALRARLHETAPTTRRCSRPGTGPLPLPPQACTSPRAWSRHWIAAACGGLRSRCMSVPEPSCR